MERQAYIDEMRFRLTGGVLALELDDIALGKVLDAAIREISRYYCTPSYITIPYQRVINMKEYKADSITGVFRVKGDNVGDTSIADPVYLAQWQLLSPTGNLNNFQNYLYDYSA